MSWNMKLERDVHNWLMGVSKGHIWHTRAHNMHEIKVAHNPDIISDIIWGVN